MKKLKTDDTPPLPEPPKERMWRSVPTWIYRGEAWVNLNKSIYRWCLKNDKEWSEQKYSANVYGMAGQYFIELVDVCVDCGGRVIRADVPLSICENFGKGCENIIGGG